MYLGRQGFGSVNPEIQIIEGRIFEVLLYMMYVFSVDSSMWRQVIDLYPALVECTTSTSSQVCSALREALIEYQDLIGPPRSLHDSKDK